MKILQNHPGWHPLRNLQEASVPDGKTSDRLLKWLFFLQAAVRWFLVILVVFSVAGCVQTKMTEPTRSAVEQLLLSTAADRSLQQAYFLDEVFKGRKVFVATNYFESYDKPYALGTIRDALSNHGALLVADVKEADIIVEPRSGALSTDSTSTEIGIPSMPVPIPLSGTLVTPDLYLYKSQKQFSTAKIALLAYDAKSGQHVYSSGPLVGKAYNKYYSFLLFIQITRTDLPEKKKK